MVCVYVWCVCMCGWVYVWCVAWEELVLASEYTRIKDGRGWNLAPPTPHGHLGIADILKYSIQWG